MQNEPTAFRVGDPGIREIFGEASRIQAWLDVEVALAQAQAELGVIPEHAAKEIERKARYENLDHGQHPRRTRPHRTPPSPHGLGTRPDMRRRRRRIHPLGRNHPEHHPDRQAPSTSAAPTTSSSISSPTCSTTSPTSPNQPPTQPCPVARTDSTPYPPPTATKSPYG